MSHTDPDLRAARKHLASKRAPWRSMSATHLHNAAGWRALGCYDDARECLDRAREDRHVLVKSTDRGDVVRWRTLPG